VTSERRIALACAAIALATTGAAVAASVAARDWSPSALVRMSATEPMARLATEADSDFQFVPPGAHYDGVYFYAIARDPFARGEAHSLIDESAYRYGHAGYGWLAGIVSLGRAPLVPAALLAVNLVAVAVAAFAASALARDYGWTPWGGIAIAVNPGVIFAATADTSEAVGVAILIVALLLWTRERLVAGAVALTVLCLVKEPYVLVLLGLAAWELIEARRGRRAADLRRRLLLLAAVPLVFAAWYAYLRVTFGRWPQADAGDLTTLPFKGWADALRKAASIGNGDFMPSQVGTAAVPLLVALGSMIVLGILLAGRARTAIDLCYLPTALLACSVTWWVIVYPKDLIRALAVPLALLPGVVAAALRPPAY
jgi:hypothetical protein